MDRLLGACLPFVHPGTRLLEDYERVLRQAGFDAVQVVDTRKDLNAYAKVESQSGCCSPAMPGGTELPLSTACCGSEAEAVHGGLAELLRRYDVNEYAASVQVYALKRR